MQIENTEILNRCKNELDKFINRIITNECYQSVDISTENIDNSWCTEKKWFTSVLSEIWKFPERREI